MSNSSSTLSADALVSEVANLQFEVRLEYAMLALILYEYALTVSAEGRHIWKPRKTTVFYLFVGLRYSALLQWTFAAFSNFLPITSTKGCADVLRVFYAFDTIQRFCSSGIFVLRVYATSNRNGLVLTALTLLFLGILATSTWGDFSDSVEVATDISRLFSTCISSQGPLNTELTAANASFALAFDTTVLALTLVRTAQQVWSCRRAGISQGLHYIMLRDGMLYFLSIELWLVAAIAVTYLPVPFWTEPIISNLATIISIVLTQRLTLNLRQVDDDLRSTYRITSLSLGELSFAHGPVLGNVGAPLRDTADDGLDLYDDDRAGEDRAGEDREGGVCELGTRVEAVELDSVAIRQL